MSTVLVTGASGGIGQALALAFAKKGYSVAVHYNSRRAEAVSTVKQIIEDGGRAQAFGADLTHEDQVAELFAQVEGSLGPVEVLVNNAGVSWVGLLTDMSLSDWRRVMDANCTSAFLCCRRALGPMIQAKRGSIINVSSMWGQSGASCEAAYSASKAALIGLTQALAQEEGPSGVRVNCIAPGAIDTPMNSHLSPEEKAALCQDTPLLRLGRPEEVAQAAVFLAENPFITGQVLGVNGGYLI